MLSRVRLPAYQFSKCLAQQMSRSVRGIFTTPNTKFLPSRKLQHLEMSIEGTRNFQVLRRYRTNDSIKPRNSKVDGMDPSRSLIFLKRTDITKLLDEARREETNSTFASPISMIMRPMSKISVTTKNQTTPPDDVETELYDVQYIMDPSYQEVLYQQISKRADFVSEEFNTSGPITWNIVR